MKFGPVSNYIGKPRALARLATGVRSAFDPAALAIFAAMTTPPSSARKTVINNCVVALKAGGVWTLLDSLYVLAAADAQAARVDWRRPSVTATVTNAPTFTADRGYTFNGSTNYLDTAFTPSTQGVNMGASGTFAVWERAVPGVVGYHGGQGAGGVGARTVIRPNVSTGISGAVQSTITTAGSGMSTNVGLCAHTVTGSASAGHQNGVNLGSAGAPTPGGSTDRPLWLGGYNAGALTSPRGVEVAAAFAGYLSTDARHLAAYNALQAYMTAVGA